MQRFWVVGGEYRSLDFDQIIDGTARVIGPFVDRRDAEHAWRDVSEQHRHRCAVRFSIAQEARVA
jgi:hypothetical protein